MCAGPSESAAEFAVSVAEPWQGKGLARLMLGKLVCRAAADGVERIVGETLASNARMLSLARKAGFVISASPDVSGLMLLEKALRAPLPASDCAWRERNARGGVGWVKRSDDPTLAAPRFVSGLR